MALILNIILLSVLSYSLADWVSLQSSEDQGHEYLFSPDKLSWSMAKEECERNEGNLLSINSQKEQDYLLRKMFIHVLKKNDLSLEREPLHEWTIILDWLKRMM